MKFCQKCGTQHSEEAAVCSNCGNSFVTQTVNVTVEQPKKKKKKGKIILIFAVIFVILIGIGNSGNSSEDNTLGNTTTEAAGTIGNYNVMIKDFRITKNLSDEDILIVKYSFTNNSDKDAAFAYTISDKLFQNGVELSGVISTYGIEDYDHKNASKEIKSGVTFELERAYFLNDIETSVDIEISDFFGMLDPIEYTIELK